ncbi:MAG TPA: hypothetical protein ENI08_03505, partial [Candidatus Dependentiae bacterium]|nr:hypothetical protein [Candidatus Dependentiae bacterium]
MFKWLAMVSGFIILVTANVVGIIYASEESFKVVHWDFRRLASSCLENKHDRDKIEGNFHSVAIMAGMHSGDRLVLGYLMHFGSEMEQVDRFKKEYEEWWNNHIKEGERLTVKGRKKWYLDCDELREYAYGKNPHLLLIRKLIPVSKKNQEKVAFLRNEEKKWSMEDKNIEDTCDENLKFFEQEAEYFMDRKNGPEYMLKKVREMLTVYKKFFPAEDEGEFNSKVGKWGPKTPYGILLAETTYLSLFKMVQKMVQNNEEQDLPGPFFAAWKQLGEWRKRNVSFPQDDKDSREEQRLDNIRKDLICKSKEKLKMRAEELKRSKVVMSPWNGSDNAIVAGVERFDSLNSSAGSSGQTKDETLPKSLSCNIRNDSSEVEEGQL